MRAYKFFKEEIGLKVLRERRLKISTIEDLNDPFELTPFDLSDRSQRRALQRARIEIGKRSGVLCFSDDWHDPVLWAHYADKHRGLCLSFEIPEDRDLLKFIKYVSRRLPFPKQLDLRCASDMLFTKFSHWSYEREVRMWAELTDREGDHYFREFDDTIQLVGVVVGARSRLLKSNVMHILGPLSARVKLIKARAGFGKFKMVPDRRGWRDGQDSAR